MILMRKDAERLGIRFGAFSRRGSVGKDALSYGAWSSVMADGRGRSRGRSRAQGGRRGVGPTRQRRRRGARRGAGLRAELGRYAGHVQESEGWAGEIRPEAFSEILNSFSIL